MQMSLHVLRVATLAAAILLSFGCGDDDAPDTQSLAETADRGGPASAAGPVAVRAAELAPTLPVSLYDQDVLFVALGDARAVTGSVVRDMLTRLFRGAPEGLVDAVHEAMAGRDHDTARLAEWAAESRAFLDAGGTHVGVVV